MKPFIRPVTIWSNIQFSQQIIPKGIHPPLLDHLDGIHHITRRLAHLLTIFLPPAVDANLTRHGKTGGFEHDGPVNCVKLEDVFSYDVDVCRPKSCLLVGGFTETGKSRISHGSRDRGIVGQGVKPHVGDIIGIKRKGNPPTQTRLRSGNTKILERLIFEESKDFVATVFRSDKIRVRLNVFNQPLLMFSQFKVVVVFEQFHHLTV